MPPIFTLLTIFTILVDLDIENMDFVDRDMEAFFDDVYMYVIKHYACIPEYSNLLHIIGALKADPDGSKPSYKNQQIARFRLELNKFYLTSKQRKDIDYNFTENL